MPAKRRAAVVTSRLTAILPSRRASAFRFSLAGSVLLSLPSAMSKYPQEPLNRVVQSDKFPFKQRDGEGQCQA